MLRLMFKHRASRKQTDQGKYKKRNINGTVSLLTQFGDKHIFSEGYQTRKEIHWCNPSSKFSANFKFTTYHLDTTRIDFNLKTHRFDISSHFHSINQSQSM